MATGREHFALDWIKADLLETLNQARIALDDFADNSAGGGSDEMRMRACLTSLHQVHGTLVMLELQGVAQLADHLEKLAQAMLDQTVPDMGSASQALMQGILELPGFIDELQRGANDSASTSMPLVNEVRDLLELPQLEDPAGLSLTAGASDEVVARFESIDGPDKVVRIRSAYQNVLLSILKGEDRKNAVATLEKIATGLERVSEGSALERQWQAFGEFVASLGRHEGVLEPDAVKLLRRVDLEIKGLAKDGSAALRKPVNIELVQQLLDESAQRDHESEALLGLQEAVSRDLDQNTLAISGRQAMTSAAGALREELAVVKDKLDLLVRAQTVDLEAVRQLIAPLGQIASTLSLLGFESSRAIVADQIDAIENLVVLGDSDPQGVQSIAGALVQVDENLGGVAQGNTATEVEQITGEAQLQVLVETRASLELVKQAIVDFVAAGWDARHLEEVPSTLDSVCGALEIVPLPPAIDMLQRIKAFIQGPLLAGMQPEWQQIDQFADVISATDYYLERLAEQNNSGLEDILGLAQRTMSELEAAQTDSAPTQDAQSTEVPLSIEAEQTLEGLSDSKKGQEIGQEVDQELELETNQPAGQILFDEADTLADEQQDAAPEFQSLELEDQLLDADEVGEQPVSETAFGGAEVAESQESFEEAIVDTMSSEPTSDDTTATQNDHEPIEFSLELEPTDELDIPDGLALSSELGQTSEGLEAATDNAAETVATEVLDTENLPEDEEIQLDLEQDDSFDLGSDLYDELDGSVSLADESPAEASVEFSASELDEPEFDESEPVEPEIATAASASVEADSAQEDELERPDPEIVEVFVEEVDEVLENIDAALPQWAQGLNIDEPLAEVRRAFHTLKGSGRIVHAAAIGELAWGIENMLNRVMDGTVEPTDEFVQVITRARDLIPGLRDAFEQGAPGDLNEISGVIEDADVLASGGTLPEARDTVVDEAKEDVESLGFQETDEPALEREVISLDDLDLDDLERAAASELDHEAREAAYLSADGSAELSGSEPITESSTTFELFVREAVEHLAVVQRENSKTPWTLNEELVRALHTLAGSSAIAGISQVQLITEPSYQVAEAYRSHAKQDGVQAFIELAAGHLDACFAALNAGTTWEEPLEFVAAADDLLAAIEPQQRPIDAFLASPAIAEVVASEHALQEFLAGERDSCTDILNGLTQLVSASAEVGETHLADLSSGMLQALTNMTIAGYVPDGSAELIKTGYERVNAQLNAIAGGGTSAAEEALLAELLALEFDPAQRAAEEDLLDAAADSVSEATATLEEDASYVSLEMAERDLAEQDSVEQDEPEALEAAADSPEIETQSATSDAFDIDPDLVDVFFEEAEEIGEDLESNIMGWSQEMDNRLYMENLLRGLHTLKGGARLCGLAALGDRVHDFESLVIEVQNNERMIDAELFGELNKRYDEITSDLARLQHQINDVLDGNVPDVDMAADPADDSGQPAANLPADSANAQTGTEAESETQADTESVAVSDSDAEVAPVSSVSDVNKVVEAVVAPREPAPVALLDEDPALPQVESKPAPVERGNQEMVRVGSLLLEELVNLAGENSILRARVEQGMSDFTGALDEMETTIERLREQLRRLEIETETQILFRHDSGAGPKYENFDPLEMDRYSQMQQLSRSLSESASDMLDLKDTLLFKARESETLLLQQARINTELQEGLMRTRMVPFNRLMPRLRRIVRQVSGELGKEVEFHAQNAEGELDRNLLERMVPPLEHMLRNAVDHGIESAELRRGFGKTPNGRIDLRLSREGGDVVIEISDDGAGIDVESVREKAIERGLMTADTPLTDEEVLQFILAAGFSTAKSVTQISGRGVGMDVVHSEVKQLGGSINIISRPGKGTRFVLRVPFTVSVNRALMVSVAEDLYAIPLNNIEGIVLLSPQQVAELYQGEGKTFEYAGIPYRVRYLGQYLGREYHGPTNGQGSVPVVLVRSGDHAVAIHVDMVQGSREIVVKSLGPQFAGVGGISGATILGDGNVVVILDLLALIRAHHHQGGRRANLTAKVRQGPRCVMVVDDSVTVRKVTSRLLERQGMDVLVAKDGVEAVALLQERKPDIMLLDIEMPRMDGFEVARQVRHDDRLGGLPIVMISSRTGDKHKEHAGTLGVNKFLGKPFQESELLATIDELVTRT